MGMPAGTRVDISRLDRQIVRALASVRLARSLFARVPTPANHATRLRAEATLDALLDHRSALLHRTATSPTTAPL